MNSAINLGRAGTYGARVVNADELAGKALRALADGEMTLTRSAGAYDNLTLAKTSLDNFVDAWDQTASRPMWVGEEGFAAVVRAREELTNASRFIGPNGRLNPGSLSAAAAATEGAREALRPVIWHMENVFPADTELLSRARQVSIARDAEAIRALESAIFHQNPGGAKFRIGYDHSKDAFRHTDDSAFINSFPR